ncbi:MAG: NAD-dependent DNA ligase LigA [Spirochaetes bacterium]|nr:NAD-dependent DNA ligase LigA [Spirochaetota bacterium]
MSNKIEKNDSIEKLKKRVEDLIKKINEYDYHYYVLNQPIISDNEYDALYEELKKIEQEYPQLRYPDSPTQRVGSDLDNKFEKLPHKIEMLSLDKIYNIEESKNWIYKNLNLFNNSFPDNNIFFSLEYKYDGLSVVLYYENGILSKALTRGDGIYGKDITENIKTIRNIPLKLIDNIDLAIKGEVVISFKDFEKLNKEQDEIFANPRNFAAGVLNRVKSTEVAKIPLKFIAYDGYILSNNRYDFVSSLQILNLLIKNKFFIGNFFMIFGVKKKEDDYKILDGYFDKEIFKGLIYIDSYSNFSPGLFNLYFSHVENIGEIIPKLDLMRKKLEYPVDGLVIKIDNINFRNYLGSTYHHPRWAFAYKFESPKGISKVIDVIFQIGRGGRITPVAILEPVEISGSIIQKATLHNEDFIRALELNINDIVSISKRGEIIPAVEEVLEKDVENSKPILFPQKCPSCSSTLIKNGPIHFCINEDCPARILERIKFFASKNGMNIETLGEKIITFLYEKGFIKDIPDLYIFDYDKLIQFDGFGDKKIKAIKESLERSKQNDFITVLASLGFRYLGRQTCELLIKNGFNSIDKFIEVAKNKDEEKLLSINGVGPKLVQVIFEEFTNKKNLEIIERLKNIGLNFEFNENESYELLNEKERQKKFPLLNTKWVVTGTFENFKPRSKLEELIKKLGGSISENISSKTDYLVVGSDPGSKLEKAKKLNIKILTEDEFIKLTQKYLSENQNYEELSGKNKKIDEQNEKLNLDKKRNTNGQSTLF